MTESEIKTAIAVLDELIEDANKIRLPHYECENDSWYSCPKSEGGCPDESQGEGCNCGADVFNSKIDLLYEKCLMLHQLLGHFQNEKGPIAEP